MSFFSFEFSCDMNKRNINGVKSNEWRCFLVYFDMNLKFLRMTLFVDQIKTSFV